jgi:hypothetical protein
MGAVPALGDGTGAILEELGVAEGEADRWRDAGVVR